VQHDPRQEQPYYDDCPQSKEGPRVGSLHDNDCEDEGRRDRHDGVIAGDISRHAGGVDPDAWGTECIPVYTQCHLDRNKNKYFDARLEQAIKSKKKDDIQNVVNKIIEQTIPKNNKLKDFDQKTFLVPFYAIDSNNMKLLNLYIKDFNNDINQKNIFGWTLLHYAIVFNKNDIVDYLLKNGADVNIPSHNNNETPLMMASSRNDLVPFVKALLDRGANMDARNTLNRTALMIARDYNIVGAINILEDYAAATTSGYHIFLSFLFM